MNLFTKLRQHALVQPDAVAASSRHRVVTYRKLWSRVERATARLKGEWHVQPGDTVVYWGQGHPDALVLYLAVARCGARLLPLEQQALQRDSAAILREWPAAVLLHDDDVVLAPPALSSIIAALSTLIATRSPHSAAAEEDPQQPSLICMGSLADGSVRSRQTSIDQLAAQSSPSNRSTGVTDTLFDLDILTSLVLPTLAAGGTIHFR